MFGDERSEHEPEEPDPGAAAENPEFDVRTGDDVAESLPDTGEALPDAGEVPQEVRTQFWRLVVLLKVALLGTTVGLMAALFGGWGTRGWALVAAGVLALLLLVVRVQQFDGADEIEDADDIEPADES